MTVHYNYTLAVVKDYKYKCTYNLCSSRGGGGGGRGGGGGGGRAWEI